MVSINNIQVYYKVCFQKVKAFRFLFHFLFFKLKEAVHEYPDFWHEKVL